MVQNTKFPQPLDYHPEILNALRHSLPVVALESTIITHGMEYPQNVETALQIEEKIRENGANPATIAIMNGRIKIGLSSAEIEELGYNKAKAKKCSRRDLASALMKSQYGSTTVAATMILAQMAGIQVFVTGGIGGVHRGAEETWDISADLTELGRTPIAVVCAGAKSIQDIPKTLEVLETQGVNVVSYKQENFPAFFVKDSGCKASQKCNTTSEIADLINMQFNILQMETGIIIGVPIPDEQEADGEIIEAAIQNSLTEVESNFFENKMNRKKYKRC